MMRRNSKAKSVRIEKNSVIVLLLAAVIFFGMLL